MSVPSIKNNNVSTKSKISENIRNRRSSPYNRSKDYTYLNIIIKENEKYNKKLLLSLGHELYMNYFDRVSRSVDAVENQRIQTALFNIMGSLNDDELKILGLYQKTESELLAEQISIRNQLLSNASFTFHCSVANVSNKKYLVISNFKREQRLIPGKKYIFDLQHPSNAGTLLSFSQNKYQYKDIEGITFIGEPGTSNSYLVYSPSNLLSYSSIFVYNKRDVSKRSFDIFAYATRQIIIETPYRDKDNKLSVIKAPINIDNIVGIVEKNILHQTEYNGPRYIFTSDASYNKIIEETGVDIASDWRNQSKFISSIYDGIKYGMYYGYYNIELKLRRRDKIAILNRGKNSGGIDKSSLIQIASHSGEVETIYLEGLDETGELDGSYNFYKNNIVIKVLGDFETCSLYSKLFGYSQMEDILVFDQRYANNSAINFDGYVDISGGTNNTLLCLHPESNVHFHEIDDGYFMTFNYSNGQNYDDISNNRYALYMGQYVIKNVPAGRPIALINFGKEQYIKYFGSTFYKSRLGPDGQLYDFFYGSVIIHVFGDFGNISLYEYNNGYCGGEDLFIFSDICSDFSDNFIDWYETVDLFDGSSDYFTPTIYDISYDTIHQLSSYIDCSFVSGKLIFDGIDDVNTKYGLNVGNYVLMDVPQVNAIAFLNNQNEDVFYYDGYHPHKIRQTAADGNDYDFYYGNVNIYINADFAQMSYVTLNNGLSAGGFRKLIFNEGLDVSFGEAIPHYGVTSNYPILQSASQDPPQDYQITVRVIIKKSQNSEDYATFSFSGRDRNGEIDYSASNPHLKFSVGDHVYFTFQYFNSDYVFGIFDRFQPITNNLLITNNLNTSNTTIRWYPNIALTNQFYYRSDDSNPFMKGKITVTNNAFSEINIKMKEKNVEDEQNDISILFSSFTFTFDYPIVIDDTKKIYIYNNEQDTIEHTFSGNIIYVSNVETMVFNTGFTEYNDFSLEFDTSYSILIDPDLVQNIYFNGISQEIFSYGDISAQKILTFETETKNAPETDTISPSSGSVVDICGTIDVVFDRTVRFDYSKSIQFRNPSGDLISNTSINASSNILTIRYDNLDYGITYEIVVDDYAIVDLSNVEVDISSSLLNDYTITIIDDPKPQLRYFYPNNLVPTLYYDSSISLIFSHPVYINMEVQEYIDTAIVTITNKDTDTLFDTIDFVTYPGDTERISGNGTNTIHISPIEPFIDASNQGGEYEINITDYAFKDISNNFYENGTTDNVTFTTSDSSGTSVEELHAQGTVSVVSYNSNNYFVFNDNTSYTGKRYILNKNSTHTITNIPQEHPIAILNKGMEDVISYSVINDVPIAIDVCGGSFANESSGDKFIFSDEDGNIIIMNDGSYKFMRGRTYHFQNNTINTSMSLVIYCNGTKYTLSSETTNPLVITFASDHNLEDGELYHTIESSADGSSNQINMSFLHKTVDETDENGNGDYDFYYGSIDIDAHNAFGSVSYYCFNHGYMGGKYAFTNYDTFS